MKKFFVHAINEIDQIVLKTTFLFCFALFLFEWLMFGVEYRFYIFEFLPTGNFIFILFCIGNMLFSFLIFFILAYISFASSFRFKIIYFLIFVLAIFYEYGYQRAYGRFSDLTDLYIAFTATPEQISDSMFSYYNSFALIPCLLYFLLLVKVKTKNRSHRLKSFIAIIFLSVSFYSCVYFFIPKFFVPYSFPTLSYEAFSRTTVGYFWSRFIDTYHKREKIKLPALDDSYRPNNNIVLVIDESVRGDHLSLNGYSRQTTSYLEELNKQGFLHNWGITAAASTCSRASHNIIITGLTIDELPDINRDTLTRPSIFQFAKAMRYKTYYLDGQRSQFWGGTPDDSDYIDSWLNVTYFHPDSNYYETDFHIAKKINEIISSSSGNFIFVFKRGIHPPFETNYPKEAETWTPSISKKDFPASPELQPAFVNAFDNALKFNLDTFFKTIASDYKNLPNNTIIIYTSDHGQTLSEDGEIYSHCGANSKEAIVPLLMFGKVETFVDTKYKASHVNIFPTILDLMNYPESDRKYKYAKSLLKATENDSIERYFFTSNLINGRKVKFD